MVKRSMIGSLSGPYFAILGTAKMDRSRNDFTDLSYGKDVQNKTF